jgi:NADH:ubiquinone oxidoreductase subunit 6 (subunit J)
MDEVVAVGVVVVVFVGAINHYLVVDSLFLQRSKKKRKKAKKEKERKTLLVSQQTLFIHLFSTKLQKIQTNKQTNKLQ